MNQEISKNARTDTARLLLILGILIFTYTLLRARALSITWDESQSYHEYIRNHLVLLQRYDFMSANNHILNTLGGIFFTELFGVSEFTLRLPSLIAHVFFLYYSAKLVSVFENKWLTVSAFLILNVNPFLLDFFCLARGYGISIGMMVASIYFLYQAQKHSFRTKDLLWTVFFGALAALGNLTLLNYCFVSFAVMALLFLQSRILTGDTFSAAIAPTFRKFLPPFLLLAAFLCFILPISFRLRAVGAFFMGGENGLFKDTLGTIVPRLWYELDFSYWLQRGTKLFFFMIFFSAAAFVFIKFRKKQVTTNTSFLCSLVLLLFLIIFSTVLQHHLLGTLYLIERTVLFLFVLLMLIFVFFIKEFSSDIFTRRAILHVTAVLFTIHFLLSANMKYVYEWKDDCETKDMLRDLIKLKVEPTEKFNLSIGLPLSLESSINYYREAGHLSWINETQRETKVNNLNDYFFLRPMDTLKFNMDSLEVIKRYPLTKNILAKRKFPFTKSVVIKDSLHDYFSASKPFLVNDSMEYSPGYSYIIRESTPLKNCIITCRVDFQPLETFTSNVYYVMSCGNEKGVYLWRNLRLNDFCFDKNEPSTANFTTFIPEEMEVGDELKIYFWNPDKQQFLLGKMRLKWVRYF